MQVFSSFSLFFYIWFFQLEFHLFFFNFLTTLWPTPRIYGMDSFFSILQSNFRLEIIPLQIVFSTTPQSFFFIYNNNYYYYYYWKDNSYHTFLFTFFLFFGLEFVARVVGIFFIYLFIYIAYITS